MNMNTKQAIQRCKVNETSERAGRKRANTLVSTTVVVAHSPRHADLGPRRPLGRVGLTWQQRAHVSHARVNRVGVDAVAAHGGLLVLAPSLPARVDNGCSSRCTPRVKAIPLFQSL
jgi:hypothetical protein